jgi:fructose-bisphosphate aldolase, class I
VLMDGDHSIDRCAEATEQTLTALFQQLNLHRVSLSGTLLKTNMVLSGKDAAQQAGIDDVAKETIKVLEKTVPEEIPGIVFLSGGQSDELATAHLNAMNQMGPYPWELSFSYGRALQAPSLNAWGGDPANVEAGRKALLHRSKLNGAARDGKYSSEMENEAA